MELEKRFCVPCEGGALPLTPSELEEYLGHIDGWNVSNDYTCITKKFTFNDYQTSLDFVNQVSNIAEKENHHPDIQFGWGYCTIALSTHSICGLHDNDFIVAAKIDQLSTA